MLNIKDIHAQYITDENGIKKSVIISMDDFQELIEDINDLAVIAERKNENTTSHNDLLEELKNEKLI